MRYPNEVQNYWTICHQELLSNLFASVQFTMIQL